MDLKKEQLAAILEQADAGFRANAGSGGIQWLANVGADYVPNLLTGCMEIQNEINRLAEAEAEEQRKAAEEAETPKGKGK